MRVIAGSKKGRRLISPEGLSTRPTTDKVKEALFSIIQFELFDADFLDLFSGSGQMGIEAVSRGAKKGPLQGCLQGILSRRERDSNPR